MSGFLAASWRKPHFTFAHLCPAPILRPAAVTVELGDEARGTRTLGSEHGRPRALIRLTVVAVRAQT